MRRRITPLFAMGLLALATPVAAFRPILHEYIQANPQEDALLGTTTQDGKLPSVLSTRTGVVEAPDTQREPRPSDAAYSERASAAGNTYEADRNTQRPDSVSYTDPFTPTIAPYKRLHVYDMVKPDGRLGVRDPMPLRLSVGGAARPDDDLFYGDITIDLGSTDTVGVPTVAAGARVLRLATTPTAKVELLHDGADNWFARAPGANGRLRLLMELAAPRGSFGGVIRLAAWKDLHVVAVPENIARDVDRVAKVIGIGPSMSPDDVLAAMIAYFRGFAPSEDIPATQGNLYLDLALSRKGVCRHRAYAFLVTALGVGIPARMVLNEAHAWVEVLAEQLWHRIDLGGAAGQISVERDARPAHHAPADPYPWPPAAERSAGSRALTSNLGGGQDSSSTRSASGSTGSSGASAGASTSEVPSSSSSAGATPGSAGSAGPSGPSSALAPTEGAGPGDVGAPTGPGEAGSASGLQGTASPPPSGPARAEPTAPTSAPKPSSTTSAADDPSGPGVRVVVSASSSQVLRGGPVTVRGRVMDGRSPCVGVRVDLTLVAPRGATLQLGPVVTDERGEFAGPMFLPLDVPVGDYELSAALPRERPRCE